MSGLEMETLQEMVQGMTAEQQRAIVAVISDEILWEAMYGRYRCLQSEVSAIGQIMKAEC